MKPSEVINYDLIDQIPVAEAKVYHQVFYVLPTSGEATAADEMLTRVRDMELPHAFIYRTSPPASEGAEATISVWFRSPFTRNEQKQYGDQITTLTEVLDGHLAPFGWAVNESEHG